MVAQVYQAELAEVQADAALAALLGRTPASAPFDRIDWLTLLARECLPGERCFIAVAREGAAIAALPLRETPGGLAPLANWYSFFTRPLGDPALLRALAHALAPAGALRLLPVPETEARALADALRMAGWIGTLEPCDTNHVLPVNGRNFAQYWAARPGSLRETVRRKGKTGAVALRIVSTFSQGDWDAYETVYRLSWKPGEGSPAFLRQFAEREGAAGALRLGLAEINGRPVAAQFWTVEGGTAWIHKLAHDETARAHSPGTLLSAALFEHVIDADKVHTIDFGTGGDPYKRDWMDTARTRYALEFFRPGAVRHWKGLARMAARRLLASSR